MEPIRRAKRVRMPAKPDSEHTDPGLEPVHETLLFARGTEPQVRIDIAQPEASLTPRDVMSFVVGLKVPITDVMLETCVLEATPQPREIERALGRISANLRKLDRIVGELADVAAIQQDRLVISRRSHEIRSLVVDVIDREISPRDRGRIFIEAPPACLAFVDATRLERVIVTLVQNALRAGPSNVVVRIESTELLTRISVIDSGRMLSLADAAMAFDPNEDGIAMYICRRIVEAHNGYVGVERSAGRGSRHYFEIPTPSLDRLQVLLVDDDPYQLDALAELLRRAGLDVTVADRGSVALAEAHGRSFDVVVLDVELPDVASTALIAQLRDRSPLVPVIVVSGHPVDSAPVRDALHASGGRYVSKPIDISLLLTEIAHATAARG